MKPKESLKTQGSDAVISGKTRKKRIKDRIKKHKISLLRSVKRISMYVAMQCAASLPQAGNTLFGAAGEDSGSPKPNEILEASLLAKAELENKINERAEWFVNDLLIPAAKTHLDEIKALSKKTVAKQRYVDKEFFKVVYPRGGQKGSDNYCIAALMRCMMDANEQSGDMSAFIPDTRPPEGHKNISCPKFKDYVKAEYPDCIKYYRRIKADDLTPGDILVVNSAENTSSGLHAKMYIGDNKELSFNNDYIADVPNTQSGYVVKTREIVKQCISKGIENVEVKEALQAMTIGRQGGALQITPQLIAQVLNQKERI